MSVVLVNQRAPAWNGVTSEARVPFNVCLRCGKVRDEEAAARGRLNRKRGGTIQRQRNRALGVTNLPGNRPNHDGGEADELFVTESKSGAAFSDRYWRWLTGIPRRAGQVPLLVVTEAPGHGGRKARSYVVVEFDDWVDLHGETP
jgi:hypothetical protein